MTFFNFIYLYLTLYLSQKIQFKMSKNIFKLLIENERFNDKNKIFSNNKHRFNFEEEIKKSL